MRRAVTWVAGTNLNCKLPSQGGQDCENPLNRLDPVARIVGPALGPASGVSTFGPGCEISAELGPSPPCGSGQFLHFGKICQRQVFGFSGAHASPTVTAPIAQDAGLDALHLRQTWPYGLWNHTYFGIRLLAGHRIGRNREQNGWPGTR